MIKKRSLLSIVLLGLLTVSCASVPTPEEMKADIIGYELPAKPKSHEAMVYVYRPSSLGGLVRFNVFLDDKEDNSEMGYNRGSQYIYFTAKPGKHNVKSKAENWAEIDVDLTAGETIFIKQNTSMGFIMARNSVEMSDKLKGTYFIKKLNKGTIIKTKK